MAEWGDFGRIGRAVVSKVKLGSAVDSPLVLTVYVFFGCMLVFTLTREKLLLYIAFTPLIIFCIGYLYFMIKDPNKLRSEEHEQRMFQMTSGFGVKGDEMSEAKAEELSQTSAPKAIEAKTKKDKNEQ